MSRAILPGPAAVAVAASSGSQTRKPSATATKAALAVQRAAACASQGLQAAATPSSAAQLQACAEMATSSTEVGLRRRSDQLVIYYRDELRAADGECLSTLPITS